MLKQLGPTAGRVQPTDKVLQHLVKEVREQPMYDTVQRQGCCTLECTVLDNFDTLRSMCDQLHCRGS